MNINNEATVNLTDSQETTIQLSQLKSQESIQFVSHDTKIEHESLNYELSSQYEVDNEGYLNDESGLFELQTKLAQKAPLIVDLRSAHNSNYDSTSDYTESCGSEEYVNISRNNYSSKDREDVKRKTGKRGKRGDRGDRTERGERGKAAVEEKEEDTDKETTSLSTESSSTTDSVSIQSLAIKKENIITPDLIDLEDSKNLDILQEFEIFKNKNSSHLIDVKIDVKKASILSPPQTQLYQSNEEIKSLSQTKLKINKEESLTFSKIIIHEKISNKSSHSEEILEKNSKNQLFGI